MQGVGYIVVLGSGFMPRDGIPVTAALDLRTVWCESLKVYGLRVAWEGCGSSCRGAPRRALRLVRSAMLSLRASLVLPMHRSSSWTARLIRATKRAPSSRYWARHHFFLVTSAYHMPRAVRLMQRVGAHPIPAPTGQRVGASPGTGLRPTSAGMRNTEIALHEYLGLAALAIGIS